MSQAKDNPGTGRPDRGTRDATVEPLRKPVPCPNCGKPSRRQAYPFCSARCADVDLNRWFSGTYAIPSAEPPPEPGADGE